MSVLRSLLTAGVLASGLLWSLNGITATPAAQASDDRYEVTQQRNPDAACLDCHKPDTEGMHGKHASVINPNNKLPVTCTNCHGQPSPQHREGVKDVIRSLIDCLRSATTFCKAALSWVWQFAQVWAKLSNGLPILWSV